jgi:hypothetical protein
VLKALGMATESFKVNDKQKSEYAKTNEKSLLDLQSTTVLNAVALVHVDGFSEDISIITHLFTYTGVEAAQDSIIAVFLPKDIANSSTAITYIGDEPEVLEDDPVLKWSFLGMGPEVQQISYYVRKNTSSDEINKIEVVPLLDINKMGSEESPTGLAVADVTGGANFWIIITGVLVVAALAGYYFFTSPGEKRAGKNITDPMPSEVLTALDAKMSSMQFEIDEKIFPLIMSIKNSTKTGEDLSSEEMVRSLVDVSNHYITIGQAAKAQKLYASIQLLYQSLTKEQKGKLGSMCIDLHMRLSKNQ